jgi:DNA-directed RNA polymerase specialized sigma24 family protein
MIDPTLMTGTSTLPLGVQGAMQPFAKGIDLAILKRGAKDYLDFLDATKEAFFAYLYHRTGSLKAAQEVLSEVYVESLSKSMSIWRLGSLTFQSLLDAADKSLHAKDTVAADIDSVFLAHVPWLNAQERSSASSLHDALWSLPVQAQRLLILSLFIGLPASRIADTLGKETSDIEGEMQTATELLLSRWQPLTSLREKLHEFVFLPSLDINFETTLRFHVVEKYTALRFRRAQWVILGGLFAVLSNVIVASVLAVAVVTQPPTSVRGTQRQLASMDALLLQRQIALQTAQQSVTASFRETQRIVAHDVTRDFTTLGLAVALESLMEQQSQEDEVHRLLNVLKSAEVALKSGSHPVLMAQMQSVRYVIDVVMEWARG